MAPETHADLWNSSGAASWPDWYLTLIGEFCGQPGEPRESRIARFLAASPVPAPDEPISHVAVLEASLLL